MPLPKVRSFRRRPSEEVNRWHIPKDEGSMRLSKVRSFRRSQKYEPAEEVTHWLTLKEELLMLAATRNHDVAYTGLIKLCMTIDEEDDKSIVTTLLSNNVDIDDEDSVIDFIDKVRRERLSIASQTDEDASEVTSASRSRTTMDEWYPVDSKVRSGFTSPTTTSDLNKICISSKTSEGLSCFSVDTRDDTTDLLPRSVAPSEAPTRDVLQSLSNWLMGEAGIGCCSDGSCNNSFIGERQLEEELDGDGGDVRPRLVTVG